SGLAATSASMSGSAPAGKSVSNRPDTPASAASRTKRSTPNARTGFRYVITITGTASAARWICSSTRAAVMPWSRAACVERWIVGPSASGSEKGIPTSMKSAPASATTRSASSDSAGVGNPAVRYGIRAARRTALPRSDRQRSAIGCSDKVVGDVDPVLERVGDLDDGAGKGALRVTLGEIDQKPRVHEPALGGRNHPHHGAVHMGDIRVRAVDDRDLVGVEDDARAHRVDADQIDERLDDDGIVAAPRVLPHFLEHLVGLDRDGLVDPAARGGVEAVGDRDDLRVDGELTRPQ